MKTIAGLLVCLLMIQPAAAQVADAGAVWRTFAAKVEVGSSVKVRLQDGRTFTATLVEAQTDALLLQPRTRVPVPVQPVPYDAIVSIERVRGGGIGAGKAAAIGVLTGVGAFFATLVIFLAAIQD
jgi:hypothetical protein